MLSSRGSTAAFFAIPALALAPVATGVAFVRHDVWGSRALLSRVLTRSLAGAVACALRCRRGRGPRDVRRGPLPGRARRGQRRRVLVGAARRTSSRMPSSAASSRQQPQYKPTIEQLSEELTSITDPRGGRGRRSSARSAAGCLASASSSGATGRPSRSAGRATPRTSAPSRRTFGGRTLGWLVVGRKRGGALFTTDDVDLLSTIANQAALALAHAHSYAELEQRRQQQAAAWQTRARRAGRDGRGRDRPRGALPHQLLPLRLPARQEGREARRGGDRHRLRGGRAARAPRGGPAPAGRAPHRAARASPWAT